VSNSSRPPKQSTAFSTRLNVRAIANHTATATIVAGSVKIRHTETNAAA